MTLQRPLQIGLTAACLLVWLVAFLNNAPYPCAVWDDAYMFVRYATHVLQGLGIAWNPDGVATWGPTSMAYLLVVAPMQLLFGDATRAAGAASLFGGVLLVLLLVILAIRVFPTSVAGRVLAIGLALATLSGAGNSLAMHLRSGMDTTFAMAYLTGYIIAAHQVLHHSDEKRWSLLAGVIGGVAPLVRPDLCIYVGVVPAVVVATADVPARRAALRVVVATAGVAGMCWLVAYAYFRTPLPLAFYVKGSGAFDPEFSSLYARIPKLQLDAYLELVTPLLVGTAIAAALRVRATLRARLDLGLLIATVVFLLYYRFGVLQVMHYGQRFYFPTLPALIYLAMSALQRLLADPPGWSRKAIQVRGGAQLVALVPWLALSLAVLSELQANDRIAKAAVLCPVGSPQEQQVKLRNAWPGINLLTALPDDLVLATTEVGQPGVLSPNRPIVDLSGLNDPRVARGIWLPVDAVLETKADVVYLHPDYKGMNRGFAESAQFTAAYEPYVPTSPRALSVYIRRNSRYHAQILHALAID